ncbi:MAG TPA: RNA polymerase sigma factor [Thermoanaerobaculia bacterium]
MIEGMNFPLVIRDMATAGSRSVDSTLSLMGEDEFRAFYERTARPLWSYLSRITGDRQQADDLLQEAYYRFYRAGRTHENESHRRNSLFQIATNLARDVARRERRHGEVQLEDDEDSTMPTPVSPTPHPDQQAAVRTDLSRALKQLEPVQREMLWLAYAQGASHEEIGEILGVRAISVRTLLLRARRKLAKILTGGAR